MEHNLKATVRYDGTGFAGWQTQPGKRTIQGEIEQALTLMAGVPIRIHGAGRTDAGAHALGQVFSFHWLTEPDCMRLRRSLSSMLGPRIRIERVEEAPPSFHARKSARAKRYAYALLLAAAEDPFAARYAWRLPWPIDMTYMGRLAQRFVGEHDFAGVQSSGACATSTVRTLHSVEVLPGGVVAPMDAVGLWRIEFVGNGFLYKMVRNITGLLVDIARGRLPESRIDEVLASPGPFRGHTAPARGLTLVDVFY